MAWHSASCLHAQCLGCSSPASAAPSCLHVQWWAAAAERPKRSLRRLGRGPALTALAVLLVTSRLTCGLLFVLICHDVLLRYVAVSFCWRVRAVYCCADAHPRISVHINVGRRTGHRTAADLPTPSTIIICQHGRRRNHPPAVRPAHRHFAGLRTTNAMPLSSLLYLWNVDFMFITRARMSLFPNILRRMRNTPPSPSSARLRRIPAAPSAPCRSTALQSPRIPAGRATLSR